MEIYENGFQMSSVHLSFIQTLKTLALFQHLVSCLLSILGYHSIELDVFNLDLKVTVWAMAQ